MFTEREYYIGSILITGAFTVHELRLALLEEGVKEGEIYDFIYIGCQELLKLKALIWSYEEDWGSSPSKYPSHFSIENFKIDWDKIFQEGKIPQENPPKSTLFLEATDELYSLLSFYESKPK